jgi:hypothetical protein
MSQLFFGVIVFALGGIDVEALRALVKCQSNTLCHPRERKVSEETVGSDTLVKKKIK